MCFSKGKLQKELITFSDENYPLDGKINPTFTNIGTSDVMVDGETLATGESFKVDAPGVVLTESIAIVFKSNNKTERALMARFVVLTN